MKDKIANTFLILLGNLIMVIGVKTFILPFNILSGGVAGVAVALYPVFHINHDIIINILIISLFIIGWIVLGNDFAIKTVISSIAYPIFLSLVSPFIPTIDLDPILASVYAGIVCGIGIGLVLRCGASTGGMDIPPLIVNKLTGIKVSTGVMFFDAMTVILGVITYDLGTVLLGLISVFFTSIAIDKVLSYGGYSSKAVWIISDDYQKIVEKIYATIDRGVTISDATGGYSKEPKKVVLCVVDGKQYPALINVINEIDKSAFVITTDATDVHGIGFTTGIRV